MRGGGVYVCADFGRGVPDSDHFDVASYEELSLSLLPIENEAGVFVTRDQIGQSAEGGD